MRLQFDTLGGSFRIETGYMWFGVHFRVYIDIKNFIFPFLFLIWSPDGSFLSVHWRCKATYIYIYIHVRPHKTAHFKTFSAFIAQYSNEYNILHLFLRELQRFSTSTWYTQWRSFNVNTHYMGLVSAWHI